MATKKKCQLPKSVLDMKFMKKTKERILKELENTQDHEKLYSNVISNEMRQASCNYVSESSFIFCEDLIEGRVSYKGMNPEIESLMDMELKTEIIDSEMQKDVSDEILVKKMSKLNKRKHTDSTNRSNNKRKK